MLPDSDKPEQTNVQSAPIVADVHGVKFGSWFKSKVSRYKSALFRSNVLWMFSALCGRFLIQSAYFIVLARTLGPYWFGFLASLYAVTNILSPFAGWGTGSILVAKSIRVPSTFPRYWGLAITTHVMLGVLISGVIFAGIYSLFPNQSPASTVILLILSEVLFQRFLETVILAFHAKEQLKSGALLLLATSMIRLATLLIFSQILQLNSLNDWAVFHFLSSFVSLLIGITWVTIQFGKPEFPGSWTKSDVTQGFLFCLGITSKVVHTDIDKAVLGKFSTMEVVGAYTAGYRLVSMATVPTQALISSFFARFYKEGHLGIRSSFAFTAKFMPICLAYGSVVGLAIYFLAPLLTLVLGERYQSSVDVIRLLAVVPVLQTFNLLLSDHLTGAGYQGGRTAIQVSVAIFNILLCLILIINYDWVGAAWATILSELALVILLFSLTLYLVAKNENRNVDF